MNDFALLVFSLSATASSCYGWSLVAKSLKYRDASINMIFINTAITLGATMHVIYLMKGEPPWN